MSGEGDSSGGSKKWPEASVVAQAYNLCYLGSRDPENLEGEKFSRSPCQPMASAVANVCHRSYIGNTNRKIAAQA
jgi:hypothetical protein